MRGLINPCEALEPVTVQMCAAVALSYRHATLTAQAAYSLIESFRYDHRRKGRYMKLYAKADAVCTQWKELLEKWMAEK